MSPIMTNADYSADNQAKENSIFRNPFTDELLIIENPEKPLSP